jgi:NADH-quinone oxidoreductase subunit I
VSGAERYAKVYNIDYNRCIFCGYCVEACPTDAITHGHGFELATFNASNLVYRKEQLLAGTPAHIGANAIFNIEGAGRLMPGKDNRMRSGANVPEGA